MDVLSIGAGAAGLRAALAAASATGVGRLRVGLAFPGGFARRGSTFSRVSAGWGMQAVLEPGRWGDSLERHAEEIVVVGRGYADPALADVLAREAPDRVADLLALGVPFLREADGSLQRIPGCFSRTPRAAVVRDTAAFGAAMRTAMETRGVRLFPGLSALALLTDPPGGAPAVDEAPGAAAPRAAVARAVGALCRRERGGALVAIRARAVVLATGGGGGLFAFSHVEQHLLGDGVVMGVEAGARPRNLEFIQFMPAEFSGRADRFFPIDRLPIAARVLVNGRRLDLPPETLAARAGHYPFSMADGSGAFDLAIFRAALAGEKRRGRPVVEVTLEYGAGARETFNVLPVGHAFNGGLAVDAHGATTLPGLFAAGECAAGMHGADRIGGCMIAATQVFGRRAGEAAARFAAGSPAASWDGVASLPERFRAAEQGAARPPLPARLASRLTTALARLRWAAWRALSLERRAEGFAWFERHALAPAERLLAETASHALALPSAPLARRERLRQAAALARLVMRAARDNGRTVGSHHRSDRPPAGEDFSAGPRRGGL
ncbi:MAG: FAD-binding protein [Planctomycetes bacterium]|nr:FAD-binding protein [Planctomycetota bacterium]